ncbi:hypothetical protein [Sphingobacterium faecium]|uniref:hypothetical protein n=1 Tax=Sphingobacterium faecium TaxID=34087 RepID=UPI00320AB70F
MKDLKFYYLALCFFSFISCQKVTLDFEKTGLFEKNDKVVQNVDISKTSISGVNGCYSNLIQQNAQAINLANTISYSGLSNTYYSQTMTNNYNNYNNCIAENGSSPEPNVPGPAVPPANIPNPLQQSFPELSPDLVLSKLNDLIYNGNSVLNIIISAYNYALQQDLVVHTIDKSNMRFLAITKSIHDLGFDGIYVSTVPEDTRMKYIHAAIEYLAGKYPIYSSLYNQYFTSSSEGYVTFPAVTSVDWLRFMRQLNSQIPSPLDTILLSSNDMIYISYNSNNGYYRNNQEDFIGPHVPAFATSIYYNTLNNMLYSDSNFTSYVPNGYYYLPEEHPNVFEKNNYLVKITNGQIVQVYRGT